MNDNTEDDNEAAEQIYHGCVAGTEYCGFPTLPSGNYLFVTSIWGDPHHIVRSVTLILTLNHHKSTEFNRGNVKFTNYKKCI